MLESYLVRSLLTKVWKEQGWPSQDLFRSCHNQKGGSVLQGRACGVLWDQVGQWKGDGGGVEIRGIYKGRGQSASTDLMMTQVQSSTGSFCTAPINSKGGEGWWTSPLLSRKECPMSKRNLCKNSFKGKWQVNVNVCDMLHWSNCGHVPFMLLLDPQRHHVDQWGENTALLCKWCNLCLCRGVPSLLLCSIIPLYKTKRDQPPLHSEKHIKGDSNP